MKKDLLQSKKFKYGSIAYAITALVIVLVIIVNALVLSIASKFGWYTDMTNSDLFTLSDSVKELLSEVDKDVRIIFCSDPDELMADKLYMQYIHKTAKNLEEEFDNITVEYHDVIKEYNFFKRYADTAASNIYTTSVIVESGSEFRLIGPKDFFMFDQGEEDSPWAYKGEKKFAASILQVTAADAPGVLFTTNHGETIGNKASSLISLFNEAGYTVDTIDLKKEEIPEDCRIIIINDPKYDFQGYEAGDDSYNEISKLDRFLDGLGALMVFADHKSTKDFTNLNEFLEEWGIAFEHETIAVDKENSLSKDGTKIKAAYEKTALGASFYYDMITSLDTMPDTVSSSSMPINILWEQDPSESGTKQVVSVLSTHDTAEFMKNNEVVGSGSRSIMTLSCDKIIVNHEQSLTTDYIYSYVFACGSPSFVSNENLNSNSRGNSDIIYSAMRAVGVEYLIADIEFKQFDNTELNITTAQATRWTAIIAIVPPAIIAIAGITVRIKRKNT